MVIKTRRQIYILPNLDSAKAQPELGTWVLIVYLGGDSKEEMGRVLQKNLVKCVLRLSLLWELRLSSAGKSCSMHFCIVPSKDQKLRILSFNSYQLLFEVYPWEHWFQPTWEHLCLNMAPRTLTRKEELWNGSFKWDAKMAQEMPTTTKIRGKFKGCCIWHKKGYFIHSVSSDLIIISWLSH